MMGNCRELADAIMELLLNSDYLADEGSHKNNVILPGMMEILTIIILRPKIMKTMKEGTIMMEIILNNDENRNNNNNDQNDTTITTHVNGL